MSDRSPCPTCAHPTGHALGCLDADPPVPPPVPHIGPQRRNEPDPENRLDARFLGRYIMHAAKIDFWQLVDSPDSIYAYIQGFSAVEEAPGRVTAMKTNDILIPMLPADVRNLGILCETLAAKDLPETPAALISCVGRLWGPRKR